MKRFASFSILLIAVSIGVSCAKQETRGGGSSPTEGYKRLFAAVKAKDIDAIRSNLTKRTIELAEIQSSRSGTAIEHVFENGFSETTFSSSLPTIRDERINGTMGAVEVWNSQKSIWEDLPFMLEDGSWKLAVGDIFAGGYRSPGKGRAEREKEAANAAMPRTPPPSANANTSVPKEINLPVPNR